MSERDPDAEVEERLRAVLERADPVPQAVTDFAKAALGWRRLDADLAELLADSALDTEAAALARSGAAGARRITFRGDDLSIEVEVRASDGGHTLLGQLAPPPAGATVALQDAEGGDVATAASDALGRFRLAVPTAGRLRLRVERPGAAPVETSWFSI